MLLISVPSFVSMIQPIPHGMEIPLTWPGFLDAVGTTIILERHMQWLVHNFTDKLCAVSPQAWTRWVEKTKSRRAIPAIGALRVRDLAMGGGFSLCESGLST